jgi:hypothetical protein
MLQDVQPRKTDRPKREMFRQISAISGHFWLSWGVSELPEQPTREAIAADLTTVARQGLKVRRLHLKLGSLGALGQLEGVKSRPVEQRAEAISDLVTEATGTLPPGPTRDAVEALLGMGATAEMPHASRRSAEMQALGLDPTVTSEHSFRKTREKELLWDLAGAIADIAEKSLRGKVAIEAPGAGTRAAGAGGGVPGPAAPTGAHRLGRKRTPVGRSAFFVLAGIVVGCLALLGWQRTHLPRPVDDLVVIHPLRTDPPHPRVGDSVTASFTVGRRGAGPEAAVQIAAGGREDPAGDACRRADPELSWSAPSADFQVARVESLGAGKELTYRMRRTFHKAGWYFAEPVKQTADGRWGGIPNANRVCFFVEGP